MHLHEWLPWSDPIPTYNAGKKQQWRVCKVCNKAKFRTLSWDQQVNPQLILQALGKTK